MKKILLGAHMPIAGGFNNAALLGKLAGCTAIQIFTKSNRQWQAKNITNDEADLFKKTTAESGILYTAAHASYLINLASQEYDTQNKSISSLEIELARCHQLGITDLVLHPGSKKKSSEEKALKQVAQNINVVLKNSPQNTRILLENMASQGSSIGNTFEQLSQILECVQDQTRIGICIDTCHLFAAGYNFSTEDKYHQMWQAFDNTIGISKIGLIHLNDSKKELNSNVDRHEDIGAGKIGLAAFELIMNDKKLIHVPKILETPKEDLSQDKKNIKFLINLLSKENLKFIDKTNLEIYLN